MAEDAANQQPSEPGRDAVQDSPKTYLAGLQAWALGVYLVSLSGLVLYVMVKLWPADLSSSQSAEASEVLFGGLLQLTNVTPELRLLLLVLCGGAIGALIHMLQSFAVFMGGRQLVSSWVFWYLTGPLKGALLGLVFYVLIRGGLLTGPQSMQSISVLGLTGASALVGLFSDQALDKLKELFSTMFATRQAERTDALIPEAAPAVPEITQCQPDSLKVGDTSATLTVRGKNFAADAYVSVNGAARSASRDASGGLVVSLNKEDVASAGELRIQVSNKSDGSRSLEHVVTVV